MQFSLLIPQQESGKIPTLGVQKTDKYTKDSNYHCRRTIVFKTAGCLMLFAAMGIAYALGGEGGSGTSLRAELTPNSDSAKNFGPPFPRIANCYGSRLTPESTAKDIDEIARIDLLIGGLWCNWNNPEHVKKLHKRIAEVRKKNPDIIILDFSVSAPYASPTDSTFPESGWLKQTDGRYIDGWPGTRMINLLKPETLKWVVEQCVRSVKERGLSGVFIDCMAGTFDWWACNIASREPYEVDANEDGQPDDRDWLNSKSIEAKTEIARQVREAIGPDVPFMTNQGGEWSFSETNGVLFEDNLDYVLDGNMSWEDVLKPYLHWTETPHRPNVTTIVSSSGIEPPFNPWQTMTHEEREALLERGRNLLNRMRFGLTTTLMGDGYFAYDLHTRWRGQRWWYPEYDAPLGYPVGKAEAQADGTWRREFDGGTVIVNPTVLDAKVHFDELRLDISSGKVGSEFIIPAYDGRLLVATEGKPQPGTMPDPDPLFTLSGPGRIVQRGGKTLCRFGNVAAYFDAQGRLVSLTDGGRNFAVGGRAVLVSDDRWIDFGYEDSASQVIDDDKVQFSGKRADGDVKLSYEQTVSVHEGGLTIQYRWKALTDGNLHAWRQQLDFPVRHYAGGYFSMDNTVFELPAEPVKGRISDHGTQKMVMIHPSGARVVIETSIDTILQDERMYNGREYRVLLNPVDYGARQFKAGDTWEYTVHLKTH